MEDENLDAREELQINNCEAHLIAALEVVNDVEVPSNEQIDVDTTFKGTKEEGFQHAQMIATLKTFIEALGANLPRQEVLKQLKFISEGMGYKILVMDSEYH